jgi:membrane protein implicated in regulation of membrane protease activity
MIRKLAGYAIFAVIGMFVLKVVFGLIGFAMSLLWTLLWLAALGFVFYLILKVISPATARRVREKVTGQPAEPAEPAESESGS